MKIDRPVGTSVTSALNSATAQPRKPADADTALKASATQVQLSSRIQALEVQMTVKSSTFDAQKVQDIRTAIAEGRFVVNAGNVADGLLASVQELIRSNAQNDNK